MHRSRAGEGGKQPQLYRDGGNSAAKMEAHEARWKSSIFRNVAGARFYLEMATPPGDG